MPPTTPPLEFNHPPGQEIETKHKEAIRQLYGFAKVPVEVLMMQYGLVRSTIEKLLRYDAPSAHVSLAPGDPLFSPINKSTRLSNTRPKRGSTESLTIPYFTTNLGLNALRKPLRKGSNSGGISGAWLARSPTL